MMRWRSVVMHSVLRRQRGRCALCRREITANREVAIEQIDSSKSALEIDNYRAVHDQCDPTIKKDIPLKEDRLERVATLLKQQRTKREILQDLNISYRTLYRYLNALEQATVGRNNNKG